MQSARELRQCLTDARDLRTLKGRKATLEKCTIYLKRPVLQSVLDSAENTGSNLGWDEVIDFVDVLIRQILQRKTSAKDTAATREEREAAINLLDLLVALSIRKAGRIRAEEVIRLITPILHDKENRPLVGRQLLRILKQLLRAPHHRANISSEMYNGLIKLHTAFINQIAVFNPGEVAEMLHAVIKAAINFAEIDISKCSRFLESIIAKLMAARELASTVLMVHVLGIWRLLFENYGEEYPKTFAKLANTFLLPTARACHDNKDNQLEIMLFLIAGQIHLVEDKSTACFILEWIVDITEKALRGARLKQTSSLFHGMASAWTSCAKHLMTSEDRCLVDRPSDSLLSSGESTSSSTSAPKRIRLSAHEMGILPAFESYQASKDSDAAVFWLSVVKKYLDECPATVTSSTCWKLLEEVCSDVFQRAPEVRPHLLMVMDSLLFFNRIAEVPRHVVDILVRSLDSNQCVERVYPIIGRFVTNDTKMGSLTTNLFKLHHEKNSGGLLVLKELCANDLITSERNRFLEWVFDIQTDHLSLKANVIVALSLKRTSCAFEGRQLNVECLPSVVDLVCQRLNNINSTERQYVYVSMLYILKLLHVRNPPVMLEPFMVGTHEHFLAATRSGSKVPDEELSCALEILRDCHGQPTKRLLRFNFDPLMELVSTELKSEFLREGVLDVTLDGDEGANADVDELQQDHRLERASKLCSFFSLHFLLTNESLDENLRDEAGDRMLRFLKTLRSFKEETLKTALLTAIIAQLVNPLLQDQSICDSGEDSMLALIGQMLLTQLELVYNKPSLVEMILKPIEDFMRCAAKIPPQQRTEETAIARRLLRRLVCGSRDFQGSNVALGRAVVRILAATADLDPEKAWLYHEPTGKNKKTGCVELLIEYTGSQEFKVRKEAFKEVALILGGDKYTLVQKRRLLDLLFDSCGVLLSEIRKRSAATRVGTSNADSGGCFLEKEEAGLRIFAETVKGILEGKPTLKGLTLANSLRLWKAGCFNSNQLLDLLKSLGEITDFFKNHLRETLELWYRRFLLKIDLNDAQSMPFELFGGFEHFMSLFGHIVTPSLLVLGNQDVTHHIREYFGGKLSEYFTPIAVSCFLLQGKYLEFFVDVTKGLDVPKLLNEYLVPIYTEILLYCQSRSIDEDALAFPEEAILKALKSLTDITHKGKVCQPWELFNDNKICKSLPTKIVASVFARLAEEDDPEKVVGIIRLLADNLVGPLAESDLSVTYCTTALTMLLQTTATLLLDNPENQYISTTCVPILERFLKMDIDLTFLVAPILAIMSRVEAEGLAREFSQKFGALGAIVAPRSNEVDESLSSDQILTLLQSVHFYLMWDRSAHPVRLLRRILAHPYIKEVLTTFPEDEGLKMHAEDISIDNHPGYVILSTLLSRIRAPTNEETAEVFPCLETLGSTPFRSWTLRPFLDEFSDRNLIYLNESCRGIVVSFAEQGIMERLLTSLFAGSKFPNVVVECLQNIFHTDLGCEIASSMDSERSLFHDHLLAFVSRSQKKLPQLCNESQESMPDLTVIGRHVGKPKWIQRVTILLGKLSMDPYLKAILPICSLDEGFCGDIFPLFLYCLSSKKNANLKIREVLEGAFSLISKTSEVNSDERRDLTKLVKYVCLLHFHEEDIDNLDLLVVARAASLCNLPDAALLLISLWWDRLNVEEGWSDPISFQEYNGPANLQLVQEILVTSCRELGVRDSLLGCFSIRANDDIVRRALGEPFNHLELLFQRGEFDALKNIVQSQQSPSMTAEELEKYSLDCAFRLGQWDQMSGKSTNFRKLTMVALDSVTSFDSMLAKDATVAMTKSLLSMASVSNLTVSFAASTFLTQVDQLRLVEEFRILKTSSKVPSTSSEWRKFVERSTGRLRCGRPLEIIEEYHWIMTLIFKTIPQVNVADFMLNYGIQAVQMSSFNLARAALLQLSSLRNAKEHYAYLEAAVQAQMDVGNVMTEQLSGRLVNFFEESRESKTLHARALLLRGRILSETKKATPLQIADTYFKPAVEILQTHGDDLREERIKAYRELASFADECSQGLAAYFNSAAFNEDTQYLAKENNIREGAAQLEDQDMRNTKMMLRDIDHLKGQIQDKKDNLASFTLSALQNYIQILRLADDQNTKYRVFSLWYSHKDDPDISKILQKTMNELASEKGTLPVHGFTDMFYQLAACMAQRSSKRPDDEFQRQLQQLVIRLCRTHPFHCVPTLLLLANPRLGRPVGNKVELKTRVEDLEERGKAARKILDHLSTLPKMKSYITCLGVLAAAYAELSADSSVAQGRGTIQSQTSLISKTKYFQDLPILTEDLAVRPDGNYDGVETIKDFIRQYEICAGLSRPKKLQVRGSKGGSFSQLLKGKDDLRQDAVMQQLFKEVSKLRSDDNRFRVRMRTYKVIPLSRFVGVIEWVKNTVPLASALSDCRERRKNPSKKQQRSLKLKQAHEIMMSIGKLSTAEAKRTKYLQLCKQFPPAFRYFFIEKFRDPSAWLERQRAYVNSLAITSMVGFIIGLGDRHTNNILIDHSTSEVVHIDLGIIFEQGKLLYTPELVPFRLTRDLVDGCGIFGIEGQFRRTCERTLEILRLNAQLMLTIVEVILLHDPLALFSGKAKGGKDNPLKAEQTLSNEQFRDRVLQRLQDKLKGIEEGHLLSVQGQASITIQQAMDPLRLAQIFHGWKPYL
ncbi:uncharacterized protein LOC100909182 [Galendromus occidentalis]|uniref:non-specific serine/threonine protein kinase n=1 Tax=Galendromus occidentalis TaxID=34638 RepID=A0AAJ7SH69_9ACAR|nr:uncharacterized protein LOC100909182 [Galendromus occidentalis]